MSFWRALYSNFSIPCWKLTSVCKKGASHLGKTFKGYLFGLFLVHVSHKESLLSVPLFYSAPYFTIS